MTSPLLGAFNTMLPETLGRHSAHLYIPLGSPEGVRASSK
jgi:hypothetical protein